MSTTAQRPPLAVSPPATAVRLPLFSGVECCDPPPITRAFFPPIPPAAPPAPTPAPAPPPVADGLSQSGNGRKRGRSEVRPGRPRRFESQLPQVNTLPSVVRATLCEDPGQMVAICERMRRMGTGTDNVVVGSCASSPCTFSPQTHTVSLLVVDMSEEAEMVAEVVIIFFTRDQMLRVEPGVEGVLRLASSLPPKLRPLSL